MLKNMKKYSKNQAKTGYTRVGKNIYKTGNRYRVRVGELSGYYTSKREALEMRKKWLNLV